MSGTEHQFIATLDSRTSAVCAGLDGKVFDIKDAKTGVNYPPLHPWCRSCTVEYDPDEWKDWEAIGQPMPERMTYDQWAAGQSIDVPGVLKDNTENGRIKRKWSSLPQILPGKQRNTLCPFCTSWHNVDYDRFVST